MVLINDLPLELKFKIFELLEIADILVARLVCKHWQTVLSEIKIETIIFQSFRFAKLGAIKWHFDDVPVRNVISVEKDLSLNLLQSSVFNLKNLKRLMINGSLNNEAFNIEQLNQFSKLEQIEIDEWKGDKATLVLPKLKRLYLWSLYANELTIESPKLEALFCKINISLVSLPSTKLRHLEIHSFRDKVFTFTDLETLKLDHTDGVVQNMLQQLPKLTDIEFKLDDYSEGFFDGTINTLRNLVVERQRLNRTNLKIAFKDVVVTSEEQVLQFDPDDFFDDGWELETDDSANYVYDSFDSFSDMNSMDEFDY